MPRRTDISSILVVGASLIMTGCVDAKKGWESLSNAERQARLDRIAEECKLSRSAFTVMSSGEVAFQPPADSRFDSVDCALKKSKLFAGMRMGFVGHEVYSNETETK